MLPEWKVVGYLHHPFLRHSEERSDARIRFPLFKGPIATPVFTLARNDRAGESLKIVNGSPCHPGCDTAPAQSIHMDLGVRMDGYGPPPPTKTATPWGWLSYLCGGELKPKRASAVKKKDPGDPFSGGWCAGGYRNALRLGRQARQARSTCLPPPPPFILTSCGK